MGVLLKMRYVYPCIGRSGLGNSLFPWARAVIFSRNHSCPMIAPLWSKPRLGPWFRAETDKRLYGRLFAHDGYVTGIRRLILLGLWPKVYCDPECIDLSYFEECYPDSEQRSRRAVYVFRGMSDMFRSLQGHHDVVRNELLRITKRRFIPRHMSRKHCIAVHVRMGDFVSPEAVPPRETVSMMRRDAFSPVVPRDEFLRVKHGVRVDLKWYVEVIRSIRLAAGVDIPAVVFSDAREQELQPLLEQQETVMSGRASPISDLLNMTRAMLIVGSRSTFSEWASFLGQVPSIYPPGGIDGDLYVPDPGAGSVNVACEWESKGAFPHRVVHAALTKAQTNAG